MKTVVVIDNNEAIVKQVTIALNNSKEIEVIGTATNGKDGLLLVRRTRPDIVITDIKMPEMDGIELIEFIAKNEINYIPHFIVITTQDSRTIMNLVNLPIRKLIQKPFRMEEITEEVLKIQEEERISVVIADDDVECCNILKNALSQYDDIDILGIANNDEEEISLIENLKPDIVITDLLRNGKLSAENIIEQYKSQKFFVVSYSPYATPQTRSNVVWSMQKYEIEKNFDELVYELRVAKKNMVRKKWESNIDDNVERIKRQTENQNNLSIIIKKWLKRMKKEKNT